MRAFWNSQAGRKNNEQLLKARKTNKNNEQIGKLIAIKSKDKFAIINKSTEQQGFANILALKAGRPNNDKLVKVTNNKQKQ